MLDEVLAFAAVGFAAQLIDGAIGMAYGLAATSVLLTLGLTPAAASASVHTAEIFTTGASGLAHWRLGNVRRSLMLRLAGAGMVGGVLGAQVLVGAPVTPLRIFVSLYLLGLGGVILHKALRPQPVALPLAPRQVVLLGFCGGLLDAIGGGGWGAIVTSTLISRGDLPREAIGSASMAEFFVTTAVSATLAATIGVSLWPIIAGLVLGGVLAAPFAALAAEQLPDRLLMVLVGMVIALLALRGLLNALRSLTVA